MRKRLRKKLSGFSPDWWSWWRQNEKRDLREARFVTAPFYCSNLVTESMHIFYSKKKSNQIIGKKFRSNRKAVKYEISLGKRYSELLSSWAERWQQEAKEGTCIKYRYRGSKEN